jgi:Cu/Ag efflux pump CusA
VLAMAVRGAILQVKQYQRLAEEEDPPTGVDLVVEGSRQRLVPTLTGIGAAVIALVPILVYGDVAGLEIVNPLALVVVGGLVTVALVNLLLLPALYLRFAVRTRPARAPQQPTTGPVTA